MTGYALRRILALVPVVVGITLLMFVLSRVVPVDPARLYAGDAAPEEAVQALRVEMGLDKPLWQQYLLYVAGLARGNLGTSLQTGRPVASEIAR
ncbi:MAG TPA: ABC transporter permease, partial [Firmicutes bacterium]|nr:ABC transporter permease [Bacillota bacterium]